ncbi:MAG: hypothetical protein H7144_14200 [Burkholderiales bacterium]|nr:hypothetical protein [Phycisphaerae bacterium]
MTRRSFIRGIGLVSAQGTTAGQIWDALLAGPVLENNRGCALVSDGTTRVSQLAIHAAREAIAQAQWPRSALAESRTALIIGTSKGPIERWIDEIFHHREPAPLIGVGEVSFDVARALGCSHGPRLTVAAACASGLQALIRADQLVKAGACDRALVIGAESSLHPLFVAAFKRLGVLARPEIGCRPFDESREGFLISEAAAAVCIEAETSDDEEGIYIHRTALAGDPYHLTGMDETGEGIRYLLRAVESADADLIHAHGTATLTSDPVELAAIAATAGPDHPVIYSHKAALGHTQGASGMISVVLNVLAHQHGAVPPNSNTTQPISHERVQIASKPIQRQITHSAVLAAGFGGTLAAVSLKSGGI